MVSHKLHVWKPGQFVKAALVLTTAVLVFSVATSRADAGIIHIKLYNDRSKCVDVKDSVNKSGQPVWLFNCSGANDDTWNERAPFDKSLACSLEAACQVFEDTQKSTLCLVLANGTSSKVQLGSCMSSNAEWNLAPETAAYSVALKNEDWAGHELMSYTNNNKASLTGDYTTQPSSAFWWQWYGP